MARSPFIRRAAPHARPSTRIRSWPLAALAAASFAGCGDRPASGQSAAGARSAQADAAPKWCLSAGEVSDAVDLPVKVTGGNSPGICQYQAEEYLGVFVELRAAPAAAADTTFERIRERAKGMLGQSAEPDRIAVGEGGWAFGSNSMSEAAAVARGTIYHAAMDYMGETGVGDKKDAMIRLLEKMVR